MVRPDCLIYLGWMPFFCHLTMCRSVHGDHSRPPSAIAIVYVQLRDPHGMASPPRFSYHVRVSSRARVFDLNEFQIIRLVVDAAENKRKEKKEKTRGGI